MLLHVAASFQPLQAHDEARTLQTVHRSTLTMWSVSLCRKVENLFLVDQKTNVLIPSLLHARLCVR